MIFCFFKHDRLYIQRHQGARVPLIMSVQKCSSVAEWASGGRRIAGLYYEGLDVTWIKHEALRGSRLCWWVSMLSRFRGWRYSSIVLVFSSSWPNQHQSVKKNEQGAEFWSMSHFCPLEVLKGRHKPFQPGVFIGKEKKRLEWICFFPPRILTSAQRSKVAPLMSVLAFRPATTSTAAIWDTDTSKESLFSGFKVSNDSYGQQADNESRPLITLG